MTIYFSSLHAFLNMGGFADFVWPAYAIAFVVLLLNWWVATQKLRRLKKKLRQDYAS